MLHSLHLKNVGPASEMQLDFAPRLNLLTGDNGLGKSFLLDVAWWALTRRWPQDLNDNLTSGYAARPIDVRKKATITHSVQAKTRRVAYKSTYVPADQSWLGKAGRPSNPGLVVYALADGGFAVWDPARNYWKQKGSIDVQERLPAYVFGSKDVWDGLSIAVDGKSTKVCNGLIADWASWIRENSDAAETMASLLDSLSNTDDTDMLRPGNRFARLSINDARDIPTVRMGYGHDVPILYASLGVRRITALAYMLTWAWQENKVASEQLGERTRPSIVMLFDEIEAHLHPRWQRAVVPAILRVAEKLSGSPNVPIQLIAATHSPLVLASLEPLFDVDNDAWFDIDLENREVELRKQEYVRMGEIGNWLVSDAFDLKEPRSLEGERAVRQAMAVLKNKNPALADIDAADDLIRKAGLPDIDRFWVRWAYFVSQERKADQGGKA